jgi:hypothetical protein
MDTLAMEPGVAPADTIAAWTLAEHVCRHCFSRVLVRIDDDGKTIAKCSGCAIEAIGGPEAICSCGALSDKFRVQLRCVRNEQPTTEAPSAIVVIECGEPAASQPAEVAYLQIDGCDKQFFRCQALRSTLSTEGCSANWRRAQRVSAEELGFTGKCRDCPIGARHAGVAAHLIASHVRSRLFGAQICPRTRHWASRLIGNRLGISSYNRAREVRIGLNAKKTRPQLVLDPRRLGVIVGYGSPDQRYIEIRDDLTADTIELAVQTLRVATGRIAFSRPRGGPAISTADLSREMGGGRELSRGIIAHAAKPGSRRTRGTAQVDRMPNEHRDEPRPDVSDGGGALARDLGIGAVA